MPDPSLRSGLRASLEARRIVPPWPLVVRGALAVAFGAAALFSPRSPAATFLLVFAAYSVADGIVVLVLAARRAAAGLRWGWLFLEGLFGVLAGVVALAVPSPTLSTLVALAAARAFVLGALEITASFRWKELVSRWLYGLAGAVSIAFGALLVSTPVAGGVVPLWTIGIYAVIFGLVVGAHGLEVQGIRRHAPPWESAA
jgi:uncharacterized membrane protein HdeD (DUF308 family)